MEEAKPLLDQIQAALEADTVPKIYVNGFINAYNVADVILVFQQNNKNVAVINMSYTTAKTLAEKLGGLIKGFEITTEHEIMSIDTVKAKIEKKGKEGEDGTLQ